MVPCRWLDECSGCDWWGWLALDSHYRSVGLREITYWNKIYNNWCLSNYLLSKLNIRLIRECDVLGRTHSLILHFYRIICVLQWWIWTSNIINWLWVCLERQECLPGSWSVLHQDGLLESGIWLLYAATGTSRQFWPAKDGLVWWRT